MIFIQAVACAQSDTLTVNYKFERYLKKCDGQTIYNFFVEKKLTSLEMLSISGFMLYHGNDVCATELQNIAISKTDSLSSDDYHEVSVQNSKNGNYANAIKFLEKSIALDARANEGYYGWLLLYYYRDYEKSLKQLTHFDNLTPNQVDAPVGENIHFLKGLCYYQLKRYNEAIVEFKLNSKFEFERFGTKNTNPYIFFYIGRCYEKLSNTKEAKLWYKKTIKYSLFPTESHFYLGLLYQKENDLKASKKQLEKALELIKKGYKQQDIYIELFDEVYQSQIEEALNSH